MRDSEIMKREVKKQIGVIRVLNPVGLLPRKAWNVLLINAYDDLLEEDEHNISIKTLSETVGFNSKDVLTLKKALQKLQTTLVEWDLGGQSEARGVSFKDFASVQMLGGFEIKKGNITYRYDKNLKNILYNPVVYQKIGIAQQKVFSTSYGLYLWENCLRFINVGTTGFTTIEEWRKLLGATAKSYGVFKDFKRYVLSPAISEVNNLSNIYVTLKTQKTGRKITHISFDIKENKQELLPISDGLLDIKNSQEYRDMINLNIKGIQAVTLIQEYGYKYIRDKINLLEEGENIKKPSGFLLNAIENDYKSKKLAANRKQKAEKEKEILKDIEDTLTDDFNQILKNRISEKIADFSEEEKKESEESFLKSEYFTSNVSAKADYKKRGITAPLVSYPYRALIGKNYLTKQEKDFEFWKKEKAKKK